MDLSSSRILTSYYKKSSEGQESSGPAPPPPRGRGRPKRDVQDTSLDSVESTNSQGSTRARRSTRSNKPPVLVPKVEVKQEPGVDAKLQASGRPTRGTGKGRGRKKAKDSVVGSEQMSAADKKYQDALKTIKDYENCRILFLARQLLYSLANIVV